MEDWQEERRKPELRGGEKKVEAVGASGLGRLGSRERANQRA